MFQNVGRAFGGADAKQRNGSFGWLPEDDDAGAAPRHLRSVAGEGGAGGKVSGKRGGLGGGSFRLLGNVALQERKGGQLPNVRLKSGRWVGMANMRDVDWHALLDGGTDAMYSIAPGTLRRHLSPVPEGAECAALACAARVLLYGEQGAGTHERDLSGSAIDPKVRERENFATMRLRGKLARTLEKGVDALHARMVEEAAAHPQARQPSPEKAPTVADAHARARRCYVSGSAVGEAEVMQLPAAVLDEGVPLAVELWLALQHGAFRGHVVRCARHEAMPSGGETARTCRLLFLPDAGLVGLFVPDGLVPEQVPAVLADETEAAAAGGEEEEEDSLPLSSMQAALGVNEYDAGMQSHSSSFPSSRATSVAAPAQAAEASRQSRLLQRVKARLRAFSGLGSESAV